ncbi:MAG: hypoxanthine phosphoribosyltransferase [Planctomycetota bacterium]|jgi:hypoxanthine phosphoribosyltransferase
MNKVFIDAEDLLLDSYRLGVKIHQSGFRPDFIIGLWRGGSPVGIAVQDCLEYLGVETDHISIRTSYRGLSSYAEMIEKESEIRVHGLQYVLDNLNANHSLLIVDDVYNTGLNVRAVINRISEKARMNTPEEIRIATPWYKPANNRTERIPDYYLHETDSWLVFPYELDGLTREEISTHKPALNPVFEEIKEFLTSS